MSTQESTQSKVSVIVPAYNAGATIAVCLESILSQNYPGLELIVVDDFSTDDTLEKASKYEVKLIPKTENRGAGHSRNLGVQNASSDIIIFVDSDIIVPPMGISRMVETLTQKQGIAAVGCIHSADRHDLNFISDFKNMDLAYRGALAPEYQRYAGGFFLAIKKPIFMAAGGFSTDFSGATVEDIDFTYRVTKGENVIFANKSVRVGHLKRYSLISMLKTDFNRIIGMMRIMKKYKAAFKVSVQTSIFPVINIFLPLLVLLSIIAGFKFHSGWLSLSLISLFLVNNFGFMRFLTQNRGIVFAIKSLFTLFIEYTVVGLSVFIAYFITATQRLRQPVGYGQKI